MRRFTRTLAVIALSLAGMVLAGCRSAYEWNQKLTIVVQTPAGEVSGSAVVNEYVLSGRILLSGNEVEYKVRGEATVVALAPGKYLFALLGGTEERAAKTFRDRPGERPDAFWSRIEALRETRPLPAGAYPLLVTFTDIADPKTVVKVDPANLAASFGSGYALKSITLEITDELVTDGLVEGVLGWLGPYPEPSLIPGTGESELSKIPFGFFVKHGHFIRRGQ